MLLLLCATDGSPRGAGGGKPLLLAPDASASCKTLALMPHAAERLQEEPSTSDAAQSDAALLWRTPYHGPDDGQTSRAALVASSSAARRFIKSRFVAAGCRLAAAGG